VVYYDQRGCGKSVREGPHSWKQHVQDLHNLLTALEPSGPIVLAGSSWGSNLALLYAYTSPDHVSALVLSGLVVWFSGEREWIKHLTPEEVRDLAALESGPATSTEVWDSATIAATSTSADPRLARRLGEMCSGNATALDYSLRSTPPLDSLRRITVPILLVSGPKPGALKNGAPTFAPFLPTAELVTIENAGHDPWFEQPDQFFAAVRRFLRTRVLK
jgi:pimeloyl-ACP methyl ester carboxylesterase